MSVTDIFGSVLGGVGKVFDLFGEAKDRQIADKVWHDNQAMQYDFAQNGIRWKVEDAVRAGINPLYAVGASTQSASPISLGAVPRSSVGEFGREMGQDISRAVDATRTGPERALAKTMLVEDAKLDLENKQLRNQLLRSQIAKVNQAGQPPGRPVAGASNDPSDNPDANVDLPVWMGGRSTGGADNDPQKASPPPEHTGLRFGKNIRTNPRFSDAQKYEDRYGDLVEEVGGLANLGADTYTTVTKSPYVRRLMDMVIALRNASTGRNPHPRHNWKYDRRYGDHRYY